MQKVIENQGNLPAYLFHQGRNFKAHEYFGCHFENDCWFFRVWAPHARQVWVGGDFNGWDYKKSEARKISDNGIWEYSSTEPREYDAYKFVLETREGKILFKADPYAVHAETRPGNASKVFSMGGYRWRDSDWMEQRRKTLLYDKPVNIYELHAGSWKTYPDGEPYSYEKLAEELIPYVKEMGYTHIELLPLGEYPFDKSWGYQVTGYFAPTSRYGTPHQFMSFVDQCHQAGIGVLLDWVPAHFPRDDFGLRYFDGEPCYEYADPRKGEHPDWGTMIFDYGRTEVRSFLISSAVNWIDNYHIDGLRVDAVASMLYLDYGRKEGEWLPNQEGGKYNLEAISLLQEMNSWIASEYPGVITIAEESTAFPKVTASPEYDGLGFTFKWNMGWMNDTLSYMQSDPFFRSGIHNNMTFSLTYAFSENYILPLSHDEVVHGKRSLIDKMPGEYAVKFANLRAYLAYMYAHPGKKLMFMGGEFAQFIEWDESKALDWMLLDYDSHRKHLAFCKELFAFYRQTPALWQLDTSWDGFDWISCDNASQNIISFLRKDREGNELLTVCNFSSLFLEQYRLGAPSRGRYTEVFSTDWEAFGGGGFQNGSVYTKLKPLHGKEYSIEITIPPFSTLYFYKKASAKKPSASKSKAAKKAGASNKKKK